MATATKDIILTSTFNRIMDAWLGGKRRIFIEGGTAASKTYSVIQFLKLLLENYNEALLATVSSESLPHLKRGAIKDFLTIMGEELIESCWNRTDYVYTFPKSRCRLEFVSDDHPEKWTGGRREILFWNEMNNIHHQSYKEGDIRTKLFTIGDWNPYGEFWFHDDKLADEEGNIFIGGLTYHDTPEVVSASIIQTIESYKDKDPNYYRVHGLGLQGRLEGLVHPSFGQVDELPSGRYFYGLDYGYLQDPTVLVKNVMVGESVYSQQMLYSYDSLTNVQIAEEMKLAGVEYAPVYPDPDEPKSSDEIKAKGFNIQESIKGPGTVATGIKRVNQFYQFWTKDSLDCIKEQRNYRYTDKRVSEMRDSDKVSKSVNVTHRWSHGMDARRYAVNSHKESQGYRTTTPRRRRILARR